ncbi:MAG: type I 3-dehydroquinate dehydratase [Elusimicrobia bacterium]|nr:type I 3-dehydroquinate dehydratase [Elusimicrobiota bacterium]
MMRRSRKRAPFPGLSRRPLVVASLGDGGRLLSDARTAVRDGADVLEVRADCFPKDLLKPEPLRELLGRLQKSVRRPVILTIRSRLEGGRFPRGLKEQDRLVLFRASLSKVDAVDVELCANDINRHMVLEARKQGCAVILSYHDFRRTPSDVVLRGLARKALRLRGDIWKVAVMPRGRGDVERFLEFCRKAPFRYRVFLAMGPLGRESRKEGFRWGSCLSYGYVRKPMAPGQWPVRELAKHLLGHSFS